MYEYLTIKQNEYVISKQILKSGTSVGANIKEGIDGQSKKDFILCLNICNLSSVLFTLKKGCWEYV